MRAWGKYRVRPVDYRYIHERILVTRYLNNIFNAALGILKCLHKRLNMYIIRSQTMKSINYYSVNLQHNTSSHCSVMKSLKKKSFKTQTKIRA